MRNATVEQFWNSHEDRLAKKMPRCVVTLTERNKVRTWELDLENPAHCKIERELAYGATYTCLYDGEEPFADGRPFEITYTTRESIGLLVTVGEPISIRPFPARIGCGLTLSGIRAEVLRSLKRKAMTPTELACDIWLRLDEAPDANPFKTSEYIPLRSTLNAMFKEGSVVKLRRGVYALSDDARYDVFRESTMALCTNEPGDAVRGRFYWRCPARRR